MSVVEKNRIARPPMGACPINDRRAKLKTAAATVWQSIGSEFRQMSADEIMAFIRGTDSPCPSRDVAGAPLPNKMQRC